MEKRSKAETFIGFSIRAKKYRTGLNTCETLKKVYAIILCKTASENTKEKAFKLATKHNCPLLVTKDKTLDELSHKDNVKIMAILDFALAKAIINNSEEDLFKSNQEKING